MAEQTPIVAGVAGEAVPRESPPEQSSTPDRYSHLRTLLNMRKPGLFKKVTTSKVLVVGAGGIGCELLKNLVQSGFLNIHTIDLDTIDISNLNRQFLFRQRHVGQSKAEVAAKVAMDMNPDARITAECRNIKDPQLGVTFFKQYDIVMNALDNVSARSHVNRLCLAADTPLLESGTEGYLGQASTIKKGMFECYECRPKPTPKTFPVCTIRHNPTLPIHCIVWAKDMLFSHMFGPTSEATEIGEAADADEKGRMQKVLRTGDSKAAFDEVFNKDVQNLLAMDELWKDRAPPTPLTLDQARTRGAEERKNKDDSSATPVALKDQELWGLAENVDVFLRATEELKTQREDQGDLTFDKDNDAALDFVTAASNIRAIIFGVETKSRFDVKAIAGNIVPAIATTNAIIASFIVLEAYKVLADELEGARETFLFQQPSSRHFILPLKLNPPNPNCFVCSQGSCDVTLDTKKTTMKFFIETILCKKLQFNLPSVSLGPNVLYEPPDEEEGVDMNHQLPKMLADVNIIDGSIVKILDEAQDMEVSVNITHTDADLDEDGGYLLSTLGIVAKKKKDAAVTDDVTGKKHARDDDVEVVTLDDNDEVQIVAPPKRAKAE